MHINKETMPELTLLIDSKLGRNRSADGSTFEYPLEPALMVPFDAEPTLRVLEANVFYTSPNVSGRQIEQQAQIQRHYFRNCRWRRCEHDRSHNHIRRRAVFPG